MTIIHRGSLRIKQIAGLRLDGFVCVPNGHPDIGFAFGIGGRNIPCPYFAKTGGSSGFPIYSCGGSEVPTERFAIFAFEMGTEEIVHELLSTLNGLGASRIGFYVGLGFDHEDFDAVSLLHWIVGWLERHVNGFSDVYVFSSTHHLQCQLPAFEFEIDHTRTNFAEIEHRVLDGKLRYYFDVTGQNTVAVTGVVWSSVGSVFSELVFPAEFDVGGRMMRITEICSSAFDGDRNEDCSWHDEIRRIVLPRYLQRCDLRQIAQHFANLDEIETVPENHHLRHKKWHRAMSGENHMG